jgi:hypothetical protein
VDRWRSEGTDRAPKSRVDPRLGSGAATDGDGADRFENGLERIMVGGLLGVNDGREGAMDGDRLGANDGLEGALLGLNDGLDCDIEGDLPKPPPPGLEPMDWRLEAISLMAALRSDPPRAAITLGVTLSKPDGRRLASDKPAW